jgi:hypothetical protein
LLNNYFLNDLELLYGKKSKVHITHFNQCTTKKIYNIHCKLFVGDVKLFEEINTTGLDYLIQKSLILITFSDRESAVTYSIELI